eukprot:CAMPEP_0206584970 /NCGR_PEP_ID=MMETSP0325_2-20121206/36111_1 /ASSEMBLY_ACC=CAM_ASM_000347 /TAXON_ID=2866 /ORGANISM="Crypthecodinium cohnii, Strain Seligo" /LENGTH=377 /DNA_ID=CAMNT_0054092373 /DNA_START=123 /DNA_END=1252 /DNA_ORIENTATION=-
MAARSPQLKKLISQLKCSSPADFMEAVEALRVYIGDLGVVQELAMVLQHPDQEVRYNAACALRDLGQVSSDQAAAVALALHDSYHCVRQVAAFTLGALGFAGAQYAQTLLSVAAEENQDSAVKAACVGALNELGFPVELRLLDRRTLEGARYIATLRDHRWDLALLGKSMEPVPRHLESKTGPAPPYFTPETEMQKIAQGCTPHAAKLPPALRSPNANVRQSAAMGLRAMGASAVIYAKDLAAALKDSDPRVRQLAAQSLGAFGERSAPFVEDLIAATADPDEAVRDAAAGALHELRFSVQSRRAFPYPSAVGARLEAERTAQELQSYAVGGAIGTLGHGGAPMTLPGEVVGDLVKVTTAGPTGPATVGSIKVIQQL